MPTTINYIAETNKNTANKNNIYTATVVANYGDPGLQEDYFADILSRYVLCVIESSARTLTNDKWPGMLVIVERPNYLWIDYSNNIFINNPNSQSRTDALGNINTGPAASYTVSTISPITPAYYLGETIQIRQKKNNDYFSVVNQPSFFQSACAGSLYTPSTYYYGSYHTQGLGIPYIAQNNEPPSLTLKTISPISFFPTSNPTANANMFLYNMAIDKYQYEAMILTKYPQLTNNLIPLFEGNPNNGYYLQGNGGYVFNNNFGIYLPICKFEDMNLAGKQRTPNINCLPLVVTVPDTFTTPSIRSPSVINYTPTYIEQG